MSKLIHLDGERESRICVIVETHLEAGVKADTPAWRERERVEYV